jgi:hypothetical protein
MDTARAFYFLETLPLGIEIQTTVYGFKRYSTLGDVVYKKYKIINGGINDIKDMYAGFFSDPDLGDAGDDYAGCDSLLSLGYAWNSSDYDGVYGSKPPAVGYTLVQGPVIPAGISDSAFFDDRWIKGYKNLNMTAFTNLLKQRSSTDLDMFQYAGHLYNFLQGKGGTGNQIINPVTGQLTSYVTSGDPAAGTGWYEGTGWPGGPYPADRRMMLSSGPFNLSPGDTQEVVFAIHIARGRDNINSITELKKHSRIVKLLYDSGYNYFTYPEVPELHGAESENSVTLWWGDDAEQYIFEDPVLGDTLRFSINNSEFEIPVSNKNYRFEGYRIWQYRDKSGKDPLLLEVSDIKNNIKNIYSYPLNLVDLNKVDIPAETIISSPDEGLKYYLNVTKNAYTGTPLLNGKEYYFGITAYAYSEFSEPPVLESRPWIIKVIPGANAVNADIPNPAGSRINFEHISGAGDAEVFANIIDINFLREHEYELSFADFYSNYNLTDITDGRILISGGNNFSSDTLSREITDGFMLVVNDLGRYNTDRFNKIKAVEETKGPGGITIEPRNVFSSPTDTNMNSTGEWTVNTPNAMKDIYLNNIPVIWEDLNDYELRFTERGSEFYVTLNSKGEGKVPFEVWSIPSDTTKPSKRLVIKILDMDGDNKWTIGSDNKYEKFDTFIPNSGYPDILPPNQPRGSNRVGNIIINGKLPASGTVITIRTWKHLSSIDRFRKVMEVPYYSNETARLNLNDITIFPNPYYSIKSKVEDYPSFIRFTRLPPRLTIRIFSLAGVYITKIEKDDEGQYAEWDLKNKDGEFVGSGIYLAYIELPGIGTKVMKIAVMK